MGLVQRALPMIRNVEGAAEQKTGRPAFDLTRTACWFSRVEGRETRLSVSIPRSVDLPLARQIFGDALEVFIAEFSFADGGHDA